MSVRRRPLTQHTVVWRRRGDNATTSTVYFTANHHDDRQFASDANTARSYNKAGYDQACSDGHALIVSHHTEVDDGAA